jgi:hypothetical protein
MAASTLCLLPVLLGVPPRIIRHARGARRASSTAHLVATHGERNSLPRSRCDGPGRIQKSSGGAEPRGEASNFGLAHRGRAGTGTDCAEAKGQLPSEAMGPVDVDWAIAAHVHRSHYLNAQNKADSLCNRNRLVFCAMKLAAVALVAILSADPSMARLSKNALPEQEPERILQLETHHAYVVVPTSRPNLRLQQRDNVSSFDSFPRARSILRDLFGGSDSRNNMLSSYPAEGLSFPIPVLSVDYGSSSMSFSSPPPTSPSPTSSIQISPTQEPGRIETHAPTSSHASVESKAPASAGPRTPTCVPSADDPVGSVGPAGTVDPATAGGGGGSDVGPPSPNSGDGQARGGATTARLGPGAVVGIAAAVLAAALVTALVVAKKKGRSDRSRRRRRRAAAMEGRSSALHLDGAESDGEEEHDSSSSSSSDQGNGPMPGAPTTSPPPPEADTTPDFIPSSSILPHRARAAAPDGDDGVGDTREV